MKLTNKKRILQILIIILLFSQISYSGNKEFVEDFPELPIIEEVPPIGISNIDLILTNFELTKNNYSINETIDGNFSVYLVNYSNASISLMLEIKKLKDYHQEFSINESGNYSINEFSIQDSGKYKLTLSLDPNNNIKEYNEKNNELIIEIEINNESSNETNQTINFPSLDIITGDIIFNINDFTFFNINTKKPESRSYFYFGNNLISTYDSYNDETMYYSQDFEKNLRLVFDESGNSLQENNYDPYGRRLIEKNTIYNDRTFSSKQIDDSGYLYFGARYYDKDLGRFDSIDPNSDFVESPYNYVSNNPINYNDPDGRRRSKNNLDPPDLIKKGPHSAYYVSSYLYTTKEVDSFKRVKTKNEILPSSPVVFLLWFDALNLVYETVESYKEASKSSLLMEEHKAFLFNQFWNKYISPHRHQILTTKEKGWEDPITNIYHPYSYDPPIKHTIYDDEIVYALQSIKDPQEMNDFINVMDPYYDEINNVLFFNALNPSKSAPDDIKEEYLLMISRVQNKEYNLMNIFRQRNNQGETK